MNLPRYAASALLGFARSLLEKAGLAGEQALVVAETLLEGDLLGHSTHGLTLLPAYLDELEHGRMNRTGGPRVLADFPAAVTWDGMKLPGPWLVHRAIDLAIERAGQLGTCSVAIRRSHHTACLAAYLQRVVDRGLMIILTTSDPAFTGVAPHGGSKGVLAPNPIAAGWPTRNGDVLMDISTSVVAMGVIRRQQQLGVALTGQWLLDSSGHPTDDPNAKFTNPPGSMLPVGGIDHGHKGYALGLLVDALCNGLAGSGRTEPAEGWSNNVYLQVLDPALFSGNDDFLTQTTAVVDACRATPPRQGFDRVRTPGQAGRERRAEQLRLGVALEPSILPSLQSWSLKLGIAMPKPIAETKS